MSVQQAPFEPFANEADVLHIGNLAIENRLDRITLDGDVDLTLDKAGLAMAQQLHKLLADVVAKLEAAALPDALPAPDVKIVDNPFN